MNTKFTPGQSGNPQGRRPGTPNKITGDLRSIINEVLSSEMSVPKLKKLLKGLEPGQRLNLLIKMTDYILPRLKQMDLTLDLEKMSDQQLDIIISKLLKPDDNEGNANN